MEFDAILARYPGSKLLSQSSQVRIYVAPGADSAPVMVKVHAANASAAQRAELEHQALASVTHPSIPRALELCVEGMQVVLVIEHVGVSALAPLGEPISDAGLLGLLDRSLQWVDALACVHSAHLLHLGISPENLRHDPSTARAYLVGFTCARALGAVEAAALADQNDRTDPLRYISPEQTGRMNRGCDARSDLYSLGAVLYYAFAGRPPFDGSTPLELIHAHMARPVVPLKRFRPNLPAPLLQVVHKLLEKQPEARYQSARSLASDLALIRDNIASGEKQSLLRLAEADVQKRPRVPRSDYGRDNEIQLLRSVYAEASLGRLSALWVRGNAGTGKSSLIDALGRVVSETSGYLAIGKCDLYTERPSACWVSALNGICQQLLLESDEALAHWREHLTSALGSIAQALIDVVPDLAYILGEVPEVPRLGPRESRQRLALVVQRFLSALAAPAHPLVLFLDDLQWADPGSRFLIEQVTTLDANCAVFVVGAFRGDSIGKDHPILRLQELVGNRIRDVRVIELEGLPLGAIEGLLGETLQCEVGDVRELAREVALKTASLPLLIQQFLDFCSDAGMLRWELGQGWRWDIEAIAGAEVADGAVAMISGRIQKLSARAGEVLRLASCAGDSFSVGMLAELADRPTGWMQAALYELCDEGLVLPASGGFRFAHDRIRESAQVLLPERERRQLHADIAAHLLEISAETQQELRAFEIADHLNRGAGMLSPEVVRRTVDVNLRAGRLALRSGAVHEAAVYLAIGCKHFLEDDWQARHDLGVELLLRYAEASFLSGDPARALDSLDDLDRRIRSRSELSSVAQLRLRIWTLLKPPVACAQYELQILRKLGIHWPLHPSRLRTRFAARFTYWMFRLFESGRFQHPVDPERGRLSAGVELVDAASGALARVDGYLIVLASSFELRASAIPALRIPDPPCVHPVQLRTVRPSRPV